MILLFQLAIITSVLVLGFTVVTYEGMGLHSLRLWADKKIDEGWIIWKPLGFCEWCAPSIWSAFGFFFALKIGVIEKWDWNLMWYYPLVVALASIISGVTWSLILLIINIFRYYNHWNDVYDKENENN